MASIKLPLVDDRMGLYNSPMSDIERGDPGFWSNEIYNLMESYIKRTYVNAIDSRDIFRLDSDDLTTEKLDHITGIKNLWKGNGYRTLLFGGYDIPSNLHRTTAAARWVKPIGLQFNWNTYAQDNISSGFGIHQMMFVYKKKHKSLYYFVPLVRNKEYQGVEEHLGADLTKESNTVYNSDGSFSLYFDDNRIKQIENEDMLCIGMIMNFWGSGNMAMDIYNFKLIMSPPRIQKSNSLMILPPVMSLLKREQMLSTPIL